MIPLEGFNRCKDNIFFDYSTKYILNRDNKERNLLTNRMLSLC